MSGGADGPRQYRAPPERVCHPGAGRRRIRPQWRRARTETVPAGADPSWPGVECAGRRGGDPPTPPRRHPGSGSVPVARGTRPTNEAVQNCGSGRRQVTCSPRPSRPVPRAHRPPARLFPAPRPTPTRQPSAHASRPRPAPSSPAPSTAAGPSRPCPPAHRHRPLAAYPPPPALWRPHTATTSIRTPSPSPGRHAGPCRPAPSPTHWRHTPPPHPSAPHPPAGSRPRHRIRPLPIPRQAAAPPRQPRRRYPQHMNDPPPEGRPPCPDTVKE
ncbi:hypothetical protein M2164_005030 [Streptomyces sp. SAI-208]|nr:hypothetical protein [Streptomyces sp. SAI-208]